MPTFSVDINCDLGESFGAYQMGNDKAILDYVSSANIACGFHAGDPSVMKNTVRLALEKGVAIGAHPGLPDLAGFGRRAMAISPEEAYDLVIYQLGALYGFVHSAGGRLHHVKPHGALYNMAAVNHDLAQAIAEAVHQFNPELVLYGLAGSELIKAAGQIGLTTASEAFADRTYQDDGTLSPRQLPGAMIHNKEQAIEQVIQIIKKEQLTSLQGKLISLKAETICIHGDQAGAIALARELSHALKKENIELKAFKA